MVDFPDATSGDGTLWGLTPKANLRFLGGRWENRSIREESRETMARNDDTTDQLRPTPVLFDLPEYDWAFAKFVKHAVDELMIRKSPLLSRIKAVPSRTIPT